MILGCVTVNLDYFKGNDIRGVGSGYKERADFVAASSNWNLAAREENSPAIAARPANLNQQRTGRAGDRYGL
jgi:hypothetical protein